MPELPVFSCALKGEVVPLPEVHLYIISDVAERFVKVGVSRSPEGRMRTLQTANPFALKIAHVTNAFERCEAVKIERLIHQELGAVHSHGEWFSCGPRVALNAMIAVGERLLGSVQLPDPGDVV